jgi:Mg2+ and Co2+ transporter CorA
MAQLTELYDYDYKAVAERLNEHENRIDRLSSAVNSAISLDDARSTSNLTILASIFIPPSLVAAVLSMNTDPLIELYSALKWWAIVSTTVIAVIVGVLLGLGSVHGWFIQVKLLLLKLSAVPASIIAMGNKKEKWRTNGTV